MEDSSSDEESDTDADGLSEPDLGHDPFKRSTSSHDEYNLFAGGEEVPLLIQAINHVREIHDLPLISTNKQSPEDMQPAPTFYPLRTPVFIGHPSEDPKVSVELGRKMSHLLSAGWGMDVTGKAYERLGHWYRVEDEIEDILGFLGDRVDLPVKLVPPNDQHEETKS